MPKSLVFFLVQTLPSGGWRREELGEVQQKGSPRSNPLLHLEFLAHQGKGWKILPIVFVLRRRITPGCQILETPQMEMEGP